MPPTPETSDPRLHEVLASWAMRQPDAPAIHHRSGITSYSQLQARVMDLTRHLIALGVAPGDVVGVSMQRSVEQITCLFAIWNVGAAFMPLAPDLPQERRAAMVADCGAACVLGDGMRLADASGIIHRDVHARASAKLVNKGGPSTRDAPDQIHRQAFDASGYVLYTSGSTGQPKGVVVSQRALLKRLQGMQAHMPLLLTDRFLHRTPLGFDVAIEEIFWPLSCGASIVLAPVGMDLDARGLLELMAAQNVSVADFVPSLLERVTNCPELRHCTHLRWVLCGGEAMSAPLMRSFLNLMPDTALFNVYGPTEAVINAMVWRADPAHQGGPPIGTALPFTQTLLLNEKLTPVLTGQIGELYLGGVLAEGYAGASASTAQRFIEIPTHPGKIWYRTGDLARSLPDGNHEFHGRTDNQIKLRGARIELGEIEGALLEHSQVRQACVVIEGVGARARLVAYLATETAQSAGHWRMHLRQKLPSYMVPALFVCMEKLPLTHSGKIDRQALRQANHARPARTFDALTDPASSAVTTESPTVLGIVQQIFSRVLNISNVNSDEDFFDLGGDSLQATELLADLDDLCGMDLSLQNLYDASTPKALAQRIEAHAPGGSIFNFSREYLGENAQATLPLPPNVLKIKSGSSNHAIFCIHPGDGGSSLYLPMVRSMQTSPTVYALTAWDMRQRSWPSGSVQDFAASYVAQIQHVQPNGPYHLVGWSSGAILAFEMARQLEASCQEIGLVALVDPFEPWETDGTYDPAKAPAPTQPFNAEDWKVVLYMFALEPCLMPDEHDFWNWQQEQQFEWVVQAAMEIGRLPTSMAVADFIYICQIVRIHCHAYDHYKASNVGFDFTLFLPRTRVESDIKKHYTHSLTSGRCKVVEVDGDHLSMMRIPNVGRIAKKLDIALMTGLENDSSRLPVKSGEV